VPAAVGLAGVLGAAATRVAGDDTTDRAQLHPRIVDAMGGAVYSPVVLGVRDQARQAALGRWGRKPDSGTLVRQGRLVSPDAAGTHPLTRR
jgi:hypothetical protein